MIKRIFNIIKSIFHVHSWIYRYTYNPDGSTDINNPGTWYGPVARHCIKCSKVENNW